jgi:hypothetical protein
MRKRSIEEVIKFQSEIVEASFEIFKNQEKIITESLQEVIFVKGNERRLVKIVCEVV